MKVFKGPTQGKAMTNTKNLIYGFIFMLCLNKTVEVLIHIKSTNVKTAQVCREIKHIYKFKFRVKRLSN